MLCMSIGAFPIDLYLMLFFWLIPIAVLSTVLWSDVSFVGNCGDIYSLGSARFLRTVKCRHGSGFVVVKIFIKADPGLSLRTYKRRLQSEFHSFCCLC